MEIDAVILAAGAGQRMKMSEMPKALVAVGGKPMICYAIDALHESGMNDIFIVKYYSDKFDVVDRMYINTNVSIRYIDDYERKGSLYSFSLVEKYVTRSFVCLDCDLFITPYSFKKMIEEGVKKLKDRAFDGIVAVVKKPSKLDSDMLLIDNDLVVRFIKDGNSLCKRGGYVFLWNRTVFDNIDFFLREGCFSLSKYYDCFAQSHRIGTMEIDDIWDVDNEYDLLFTNHHLRKVNN